MRLVEMTEGGQLLRLHGDIVLSGHLVEVMNLIFLVRHPLPALIS